MGGEKGEEKTEGGEKPKRETEGCKGKDEGSRKGPPKRQSRHCARTRVSDENRASFEKHLPEITRYRRESKV